MICKTKSDISLFLLVATSYFYTLELCCSVSVGRKDDLATDRAQLSDSRRTESDEHRLQGPSMESAATNHRPPKSSILGAPELRRDSDILFGNFRESKVDKTEKLIKVTPQLSFNNSLWVVGKIISETETAVPDSEDGYQADFTDFPAVKGHILGLLSDSSPHYSHWEAMKPLVKCSQNSMIFTASGPGSLHMQVDRKGGYPMSIFHLPPYCGYSVKTSHLDLEMTVPYNGCYVTQENGSYVLPMWWFDTPLKLSCPVKMPTGPTLFSPSSPSVFCSPYGMAVQIQGLQHDSPQLGVIVNGVWGPFVSELCAFQVDSQPQEHTFLISDSASCITTDDGLQLHFTLDTLEYILSCPVIPQFPYTHSSPQSASFRRDPQFPYIPDPVISKPIFPHSNPSQTQNKEHTAQLPNYVHYYPYSLGLQSQQLSQAYPPPPESSSLPQATTVGTPSSKQKFQYHLESGKMSSFGQHLPYLPHSYQPLQGRLSQVFKSSVNPQQYPLFFYYPQEPFHYMASNPAVKEHPKPQAGYTEYNPQIRYQPEHIDSPVTQVPVPHPASIPKQPKDPHQTSAVYPPFSFYPHQPVSYSDSLVSPTATTTDSASYSFGQFDAHHPLPPPIHPPSAGQKPHGICLPSDDATCHTNAYYPYHAFYPQHYYQPHPSLPNYSKTKMTKIPLHLQCLKDRMLVFLPHADPESIQVRDYQNKWWFLSNVSSHCGYVLQMTVGHAVILQSPIPACHSYIQTPTTISLQLKYWDFSIRQNRTEALQCPYQGLPVTLAPAAMYAPPTPPRGIQGKTSTSIDLKTEVLCSFQKMNVVLPPGPITEIVVKDIKGNQINQIASAEDCGYYASKGKDGKIHVTLHFHSHCPTSVQDEMYITSIIYVTESGRKEAWFSCPVVIPRTGHECNLQSEYRLPCGSTSISQTQCLSIGCCFNKHPPACYYAMDECTIDRHMIFSVPASLTNPPLSPALLVAANNSTCKPQKATSDYALFNIPMDGCGTRRVMVGKTVVYMLEITNMIQAVSLNYGTITRDSPIRLLVECRYVPGTALTVSYVVKTPTFGPDVHSQGVLGVQLRIAKDAQYSSYYPQYHQPLHMLLGKPLYLELRLLNSPDPSLVLLVHFCVAYPRSGKAVWVLLYNGCPNPLDPVPPKTVLSKPQPSSPQSQTRRFTISTFQFLPDGELKDMDEEIYFMCSTEICSPHDGPCVEGCFGH